MIKIPKPNSDPNVIEKLLRKKVQVRIVTSIDGKHLILTPALETAVGEVFSPN
ncbi:hypothetical protein GJU40_06505 [Bacillus lacus]|uniref:Uncharacterized protein n=1 Tax=Metabacillus lacus TaxID=1983721 RepID=A0A7X2LXZ3_9BACI|nr:hypothetical protein [Metabacillus lacus]MRX71826.1 hypothetical protein [Metabacillus lacus]